MKTPFSSAVFREHPYDAAVVGGGPAGCSAAITLASLGARVVLLEARSYPHDKLCGEFLSPECAILLDELGMTPALHALQPAPIEVACLSAPDGTTWEMRLPGLALGLSRSRLDAAMAEHAAGLGVEVRQGTSARGIRGDLREGFMLETRSASGPDRLHARLVIAAHGKRGALDRSLGRRFLDKRQPFVALKSHFSGPPLKGRIELHAFQGGYCGMSEIEGGVANVCLLAHESVFKDVPGTQLPGVRRLPSERPGVRRLPSSAEAQLPGVRRLPSSAEACPDPGRGGDFGLRSRTASPRIAAFLEWMQAQNPRLRDWLSQAEPIDGRWLSIGEVPFLSRRSVVGDVLMAGDAAGLIVPLAGDGIAMALQSGRLAASHGAQFLTGRLSADELRRQYAASWRREFGARLKLGRVLQALMLRPRLLSLTLRLLSAFPPLGETLVRRTRNISLLLSKNQT